MGVNKQQHFCPQALKSCFSNDSKITNWWEKVIGLVRFTHGCFQSWGLNRRQRPGSSQTSILSIYLTCRLRTGSFYTLAHTNDIHFYTDCFTFKAMKGWGEASTPNWFPWHYLKPRLSQTLLGRFNTPTITHPNVNERHCCRSKRAPNRALMFASNEKWLELTKHL